MKDNVKCHTANYFDTFIEVAEDCPATIAALPPAKAPISVVRAQFEMIINNPYRYSSDDVLFETIGRPKKSAVRSFLARVSRAFELRLWRNDMAGASITTAVGKLLSAPLSPRITNGFRPVEAFPLSALCGTEEYNRRMCSALYRPAARHQRRRP